MNCDEYKQIKARYLKGNVTIEEEQAIESHLETCTACHQTLDEDILHTEPVQKGKLSQQTDYSIDEHKQTRILRRAKYKNRFSLTLFLLSLFFVLTIAGLLSSSYYFNRGDENSRLYRVQKTAATLIDFTFPNVSIQPSILFSPPLPPWYFSSASWGQSSVEIKPYFTAQGTYVLQKRLGKESIFVGNLNINQFFNFISRDWNWKDGAYRNYLDFVYPTPNSTGIDPSVQVSSPSEKVWKALTILPEGTVAEMAVSFDTTYSIDDLKEVFRNYDLDICWYAVYTGVEDSGDFPYEKGYSLSAFGGVWGFSSIRQNDDLNGQKYFLDNMQFLAENQATAEKFYRGNHADLQLDKRNDYVQKNGIKVYGVVVTGPTKELLKLRELPAIHHPALGEVALWNWFNRSFSGQMY